MARTITSAADYVEALEAERAMNIVRDGERQRSRYECPQTGCLLVRGHDGYHRIRTAK